MKIKVTQFIFGEFGAKDSWFKQYVEPINRLYCEIHGYEYILDEYSDEHLAEVSQHRHPVWLKVPHIKGNMNHCDYLLFVDADAVFYNHLFRIEEELFPLLQDADVLVAKDRWAEDAVGQDVFNSGVILFRNSEAVHEILEAWDDLPTKYPNDGMVWGGRETTDQKGLVFLGFHPAYRRHFKIVTNYYKMNGEFGYYIRHLQGFRGQRGQFEQIYHSPLMERNRRLLTGWRDGSREEQQQ
jgi:hypothetical protein